MDEVVRQCVGNELRRLRQACENRPSQDKLADRLAELLGPEVRPVEGNQLGKWERGRTLIPRRYLFYLLKLFARDRKLKLPPEEAQNLVLQASYVFSETEWQQIYAPFELMAPVTDVATPPPKNSPSQHRIATLQSWLIEAIQEARRRQANQRIVELSIELARLYQQQGHFQSGITIYERVMRIAQELDDGHYLAARVQSNLAYLYTETNEALWPQAEQLCSQALQTFEQLARVDKTCHVRNHLGVLYTRWRRYHPAQFHLQTARRLWEKRNDKFNLLSSFINLGLCSLEMEDYSEALNYLKLAGELAPESAQNNNAATIQMNQAIVYHRTGKLDQAEVCLHQAETIFEAQNNLSGLAQTWGNMGLVLLDQECWVAAHYYLDSSWQMWRYLNNSYNQAMAQNGLMVWQQRCNIVHRLLMTDDVADLLQRI